MENKESIKEFEKESIYQILSTLIEMEKERNALFKKTLYIFLAAVISITAILCIANIVSLNTLFIN